jgi:3-deoxy-D-manno-octulosonate 8-phosphate phosphatase (KDO 8-P phosphatase)
MSDLGSRAAGIRLVVLDVDGVLTDGQIVMDDQGRETKAFNVRDGHGLKMLMRYGIGAAVVTGRRSEVVARRTEELGIHPVFQGYPEKAEPFEAVLAETGMPPEAVAVVGDDVVDLPMMARAGLAIAPVDAHDAVRNRAHWVTAAGGGRGAVREVVDFLLQAQGHWTSVMAHYWPEGA